MSVYRGAQLEDTQAKTLRGKKAVTGAEHQINSMGADKSTAHVQISIKPKSI